MSPRSSSPPAKRIKLEGQSPIATDVESYDKPRTEGNLEDEENNCSICLQSLVDRTVVPGCSHEFCFECLLVWSEQSRRCPLCSGPIGEYLIHDIRSGYDYRKYYLPPLRSKSPPPPPVASVSQVNPVQRRRRAREWGRREREREEADRLERSIRKRRWIYEHHLYAKHVASNPYTKYRPYPTPAQFAASPDLISRTTSFLRRELRVWENMDVEFLTTFTISLMKAIDIRSESAIKLLAEFLDMDVEYTPGARFVNAEHFAHEVYSYVRSPYKDLFVYDTIVQYDFPPDISPPEARSGRRWRENSPASRTSRSRSRRDRSPSPRRTHRSRSRSLSWSPSGRTYPSERQRVEEVLGSRNEGEPSGESDRGRLPRGVSSYSISGEQTVERERERASTSAVSSLDHTGGRVDQPLSSRPCSPMHDDLRVGKSEKGKQRADIPLRGDIPERSISATPNIGELTSGVQVESSTPPTAGPSTPVIAPHPTPAPPKPPRHRTLRDSVHAHLKQQIPRVPAPQTHQHNAQDIGTSSRIGLGDDHPSLLHRLSEPGGRSMINTGVPTFESMPRSSTARVSGSLEDTFRDRKKTSLDPDARVRTPCHMAAPTADFDSTPDSSEAMPQQPSHSIVSQSSEPKSGDVIQAHDSPARAVHPQDRLPNHRSEARDDSDTVRKNSSSPSPPTRSPSTTPNGTRDTSPHPRATSSEATHVPSDNNLTRKNPFCGDNSINGKDGTHQTSPPLWDSRTRLLTRLEQEKHEAVTKAALASRVKPPSAHLGSSEQSGMPVSEDSFSSVEEAQQKDSRVLEKRLRARVQLHSRLVAERRRAEAGNEGS